MSNYVLVCHGDVHEFGSFSLAKDQEVQYGGNFGAVLPYGTAIAVYKAIYRDPTTPIKNLAIENFDPPDPLVGPGSFKPDFDLSGDDKLLLFLMNLNTRAYMRLGGGWKSRLSTLVTNLGKAGEQAPFVLYLMCCTAQEGVEVPIPQGASLVSVYEKLTA